MANIFQELQMASANQINEIADARKKMNELLQCFLKQERRMELLTYFAEKVRHLDIQTLVDCDSFMIQDEDEIDLTGIPAEYMTDTYGLFKGPVCVFMGRYVYPVKDVHGDVMGWVGYDKFSDVKYLDSLNYGYKAKHTTLWGMEMLPEYYRSGRQVWFTEGVVCALYARQCGEQALACLGSNVSPYVAEIIKRFGPKARILTDSDEAGNKFKRLVQRQCPQARVIQSRIAKDLDDSKEISPEIGEELKKFENRFYVSKYFT